MSQPHQIAIVSVNMSQTETIQLGDIFGRVPVEEMVEVLNSEWATQRGWQTVQSGVTYQRQIAEDINLEVRIGEQGQVTVQRHAPREDVQANVAAEVRAKQNQRLQETNQACDFAVNELVSQAMMLALPRRAEALGYVTSEPVVRQQVGAHEVVVQVRLNI